jgi:putative hydrolase of the HAD superfamily
LISTFLFDLDDTLLDRDKTIEPFIQSQYDRFEIHHIPYERYHNRFVEVDNHGYIDKHELYQMLITEFNLPFSIEELVTDFWNNAWKNSQLFPGAKEVLQELRLQGFKLGIVTNGLEKSQNAKILTSSLNRLVDVIIISDVEKVGKPDAGIFDRATKRLGVEPGKCVFIGDNPRTDIEGAKKFGMKTAWIERHLPWPSNLDEKPDFILKRLDEILDIVFQGFLQSHPSCS